MTNKMRDNLRENWEIVRHVYDGYVMLTESGLLNMKLPQRHFDALKEAMETKPFKGDKRKRKDDLLINAIGNWLRTTKFGAWRNTNREYAYKDNNKELWQAFVATNENKNYSLTSALIEAGRFGN